MRLEFHRQVASDVSRIMEYYENTAGPQLADEFYAELRICLKKAAESPQSCAIREGDLRRMNLEISVSFFVSHRQRTGPDSGSSSSQTTTFGWA
jgi:plasmid stabilization system protein ParE